MCLQLLLCVKSTGYEATVSYWTPVLHFFCLTSRLKKSLTVPHLNLSAPPLFVVSYQHVRKPASHGCLLWGFIVVGGPQSSLNIVIGICLDFGLYLELLVDEIKGLMASWLWLPLRSPRPVHQENPQLHIFDLLFFLYVCSGRMEKHCQLFVFTPVNFGLHFAQSWLLIFIISQK